MATSLKDRRKEARKWQQLQRLLSGSQQLRPSCSATECLLLMNIGVTNDVSDQDLLALKRDIASFADDFVELVAVPGAAFRLAVFASVDAAAAARLQLHLRQIATPLTRSRQCVVIYAFFVELLAAAGLSWTPDGETSDSADQVARCDTENCPPGLSLLPDFISEEEEAQLLKLVDDELAKQQHQQQEQKLKLRQRQVLHWGLDFCYDTNSLRQTCDPAKRALPPLCLRLLQRRLEQLGCSSLPDQLTVNVYEPGQGIAAHVDAHECIGEPLISLSCGSQCAMQFANCRTGTAACLLLPRRSLLLLRQEARLLWSHCVPPRCSDLVADVSSSGEVALRLLRRARRVSFTFRFSRTGPCLCDFPEVCNSHRPAPHSHHLVFNETNHANHNAMRDTSHNDKGDAMPDAMNEASDAGNDGSSDSKKFSNPSQLEQQHVHKVYEAIAMHFSSTRHSQWPRVSQFVSQLAVRSVVLDVGCGNGKNMFAPSRPDLMFVGCDMSDGLCDIAASRGLCVARADALHLPFVTAAFDCVLSIAVLHHFCTTERRLAALQEMARVCRSGGVVLVYVWAVEQVRQGAASAYLRSAKAAQPVQHAPTGLMVHTGGAEFTDSDMLVPWKQKKQQQEQQEQQLRYYHLFSEGELQILCNQVPEFAIKNVYYDNGNWCASLVKQ